MSVEPADGEFGEMFFQHVREHCKEFKAAPHFGWIGEHVVAAFQRVNVFVGFGATHKHLKSCVAAHAFQKISLLDRTKCDKPVILFGDQFDRLKIDVCRQIGRARIDQWIVKSMFSERLRKVSNNKSVTYFRLATKLTLNVSDLSPK